MIYTENNENKAKKKSKLTTLGYAVGILLILSGVGAFSTKEMGVLVGLGYIISGLAVFPPFWRFIREKYNFEPSRPLKVVTFLVAIGVTGGFLMQKAEYTQNSKPVETPNTKNVQQNTVVAQPEERSEKVQEPQVVPFNIVVSSQIVKKVNGKCRYFFDIRNNDSKDFEGTVEITLMKSTGSTLGRETFNTTKPIEPTLGSPVYFDINTCPGGEYGISDYSYKVTYGKNIVAEGKDKITSKYENLSY